MTGPNEAARNLWRQAGKEPSIEEVLADPVVHSVMRRDSVSIDGLRAVIVRAQAALRSRRCCRVAA
ncbi:MAG TPA: hypothetical protein VK433_03865 [Stellaceae bacterium]|nr:hypothetical protein [Stellaceae bacterium]